MDEQKMISVEKMDEIIRDYYPETVTVDFHGQELVIRKTITLEEMKVLVNAVVEACFDNATGEYLSEFEQFITDILVVALYTNVDIPNSVEKQYGMMRQTDLMSVVYNTISDDQLREITCAINAKVRLRNNQNTKVVERQIQDATASITSVADLLDAMFDGLDRDDVKNIAKAIGDGGVDMEKLISSVIEKQAERAKETELSHEVILDGEQ